MKRFGKIFFKKLVKMIHSLRAFHITFICYYMHYICGAMHTSRAPNLLLKIFPPQKWRAVKRWTSSIKHYIDLKLAASFFLINFPARPGKYSFNMFYCIILQPKFSVRYRFENVTACMCIFRKEHAPIIIQLLWIISLG